MADTDDKEKKEGIKEENTKAEEDTKTDKNEQSQQTGTKTSILTWIIMAVIVVLLAGSGFFLGRLFAGSSSPKAGESSQENTQTEEVITNDSETDSKDTWYYNELEPVVVNPDEPGATRLVRVALVLEMSSALSKENAQELIDAHKPPLINWLNLYFKTRTLKEMENDKDMTRILSQICDAFNEMLFPDAKPQIKKILIREFNIQ